LPFSHDQKYIFGKGRQKLAATLSEKKKIGHGILGQCREWNMPKIELCDPNKIDFMTATGVIWEIGGPNKRAGTKHY
jgi:hypothetical protein